MKRIFSKEKSRKEKKADFYILYTIVRIKSILAKASDLEAYLTRIEEAKKRGEHSYTFINLSSYVRHILMKVGYKIRFSIDENWNGVYKVEW